MEGRGNYRFRKVDCDPGHANKRAVEVLDGPCSILMRLVTNKTDAAVGDQLDIGDFAPLSRKVFAKIGFGDVGREVVDENSRRLHGGSDLRLACSHCWER